MVDLSAALFTKLLNLGSDWEVYETSYSSEKNVILLRIRETAELGYEGSSASTQGHEFFHHEFTQSELRRRYENQALENQGARQEIISMLFRETNNHALGSSHSARVRAQIQLSKIFGLETIQVDAKVEHSGGVMVVPMSSSIEEWEAAAVEQQRQLMKDAVDI